MTPGDDLMQLARLAVGLGICVVACFGLAVGALLTLVVRGLG